MRTGYIILLIASMALFLSACDSDKDDEQPGSGGAGTDMASDFADQAGQQSTDGQGG